jgi:hypothetical protein
LQHGGVGGRVVVASAGGVTGGPVGCVVRGWPTVGGGVATTVVTTDATSVVVVVGTVVDVTDWAR